MPSTRTAGECDLYKRAREILRLPYPWLWAESDIDWAYNVMIQRYQELCCPTFHPAKPKKEEQDGK